MASTIRPLAAALFTPLAALMVTLSLTGTAHAATWYDIDYFGSDSECFNALPKHKATGSYAKFRCQYTGESNPWADWHLQGSDG